MPRTDPGVSLRSRWPASSSSKRSPPRWRANPERRHAPHQPEQGARCDPVARASSAEVIGPAARRSGRPRRAATWITWVDQQPVIISVTRGAGSGPRRRRGVEGEVMAFFFPMAFLLIDHRSRPYPRHRVQPNGRRPPREGPRPWRACRSPPRAAPRRLLDRGEHPAPRPANRAAPRAVVS